MMKTLCSICSRTAPFFCRVARFTYYQCSFCKTLFLYPTPRPKEIKQYYSTHFEYSAGRSNESRTRNRSTIIIEKLKTLNPNGKTLLDIGAGYGYFLEEAAKIGLVCVGLEPSKELYRELHKKNLPPVLNLSIQDFLNQKPNQRFDFITLIHTIEHLVNPVDILRRVMSLLTVNGILFIETPNLDSHLFKAELEKYTFLTPPDHLWIFSKRSFEVMTHKIEHLTIREVYTYSYPEHVMGIAKTILKRRPDHSFPDQKKTTENHHITQAKIALFDRFFAKLVNPLLNLGNKGSILELYINKK